MRVKVMRLLGIVLVAGLAGCVDRPPGRDVGRLAESDRVVIFDVGEKVIGGLSIEEQVYKPLSNGSGAIVLKDDGPIDDRYRPVNILPDEGQAKGEPVSVPRLYLRLR